MVGVAHFNIIERETELKDLLRTQKNASRKERIQLLYLGFAEKVLHGVNQAGVRC